MSGGAQVPNTDDTARADAGTASTAKDATTGGDDATDGGTVDAHPLLPDAAGTGG